MGRAAVLIGCLSLLAPAFGAEPPSPFPSDIHGLSAYLGTPTRPDRARTAWRELRTGGPENAVRLAAALGLCGGAGALEPLENLLRDRSSIVRRAASRALGRVGLRDEGVAQRLREVVRWRTGAERRAAMLALGRIGDGRDVDTLLALSLDADEATSLTAFRALGPLTGMKLPPVHARWSYWWRSAGSRLRADVKRLLDRIEEERKSEGVVRLRALLARQAWADLLTVRTRLERWLVTHDDNIRVHAVVLTGELRLAELAPRVERVQGFARREGPLAQAAEQVLSNLGLLFPAEPEQKPERETSPEFGGPPIGQPAAPTAATPPAEAPPAAAATPPANGAEKQPADGAGKPPADAAPKAPVKDGEDGEQQPAPSGAPAPEKPAAPPAAPR